MQPVDVLFTDSAVCGNTEFFAHGINEPNNWKECKVMKVAYFSKS